MARSNGFTIDTSDLSRMAKEFEEAAPGVQEVLSTSLREGAALVATSAKALASWSSRIPGTVKVAGGGARIVVRAGGAGAPHAAAYEHGGLPGQFRHPVFGNRDVWVNATARPFLGPAQARNTEAIVAAVERGIDGMFEKRFR